MQKLTLSPTRHSLVLIPLIITLFVFGISEMFSQFKFLKNFKNIFLFSFCIINIFVFIGSYKNIYDQRTNPFLSDVNIINVIEKYNISKIAAYGYTGDINFFPEINLKFDINWSNQFPFTYVIHSKKEFSNKNQDSAVMILCANSEICGNTLAEELALQELGFLRHSEAELLKPLFSFEADSNVTNGFSNMAGSGTRRIFLKVYGETINTQ